ncbi:MAG: DUF6365 family protein [Kofleriaceae bacterium]
MAQHLFLAVTAAAYGEAVLGMRLACELRERGHDVRVLAPRGLRPVFEGAGVKFGAVDDVLARLDRTLVTLVDEQKPTSLTLIDGAAVFQTFDLKKLDPSVFTRLATRVLALDTWNIDESGLVWDHGGGTIRMDPRIVAMPRIVPVPFARPTAVRGYNALPALGSIDRREARAQLGVGEDERVVFWPTAMWQAPRFQPTPDTRTMAERVPELVASYLAALGPDVRVVQVGPEPMRAGATLGARFRWFPRQTASRFHALLAASDVMLGANLAATTLPSAIVREVPSIVAINTRTHVDRVGLGDRARRWLDRGTTLYPFRVWPAGLSAVLAPVMRDNPLLEAIDVIELLDEDAMIARMRALLFDDAAAAEARQRLRAYRTMVTALPSAATMFEASLEERA